MKAKLVKESLNEESGSGRNIMMSTLQELFSSDLFAAVEEALEEDPSSLEAVFEEEPEIIEKLEQKYPGISQSAVIDRWFFADTLEYYGEEEDDNDDPEIIWPEAQDVLMKKLNFQKIPLNSEYYDEMYLDPKAKIGYIEAEKNNPYQSGYNIWFFQAVK